jgi:hypothetical protein
VGAADTRENYKHFCLQFLKWRSQGVIAIAELTSHSVTWSTSEEVLRWSCPRKSGLRSGGCTEMG